MKYYIIAGEASGDLHGSNLMKGIYAEDPHADIRFWGEIKKLSWSSFVTGITQPELIQYLKERSLYINEPVCITEEEM